MCSVWQQHVHVSVQRKRCLRWLTATSTRPNKAHGQKEGQLEAATYRTRGTAQKEAEPNGNHELQAVCSNLGNGTVKNKWKVYAEKWRV